VPKLERLQVRYRDRGQIRKVTVWADARRGYRADLRAFADVGGGREALKQPGAPWATTDALEAEQLAQRRIAELQERRKARREGRPLDDPRLADFAETHLARKAQRPRIAASTVARDRLALDNVLAFDPDVRLSAIDTRSVAAFIRARRADGRAERTILNECHALSNLWTYAKAEGITRGDNPVVAAKELEHLEPVPHEAVWLETGEVVRLLDAARALDLDPRSRFCPTLHTMLAGFVLSGLRKQELFGLERADVDLDDNVIRVRPNRWRTLKSRHSKRDVPLWPQLRAILTPHLAGLRPGGVLLFPSYRHLVERPYAEIDHALAAAVQKAEIEKPVTLHSLRHTYCTARLNTLDGGAPVSIWTVACELGHRDTGMIERVYGHVLQDRDRHGVRRDVLEYVTATVLPLAARRA